MRRAPPEHRRARTPHAELLVQATRRLCRDAESSSMRCAMPRLIALASARSVAVTMLASRPDAVHRAVAAHAQLHVRDRRRVLAGADRVLVIVDARGSASPSPSAWRRRTHRPARCRRRAAPSRRRRRADARSDARPCRRRRCAARDGRHSARASCAPDIRARTPRECPPTTAPCPIASVIAWITWQNSICRRRGSARP